MTNFEIGVAVIVGVVAVVIFVRFWFLIVTGTALWWAISLYNSDGAGGNYWPIFFCWLVAFGVLSNFLGFSGGGGFGEGETLAQRDAKETAVRNADYQRREFNKRF